MKIVAPNLNYMSNAVQGNSEHTLVTQYTHSGGTLRAPREHSDHFRGLKWPFWTKKMVGV